MPHLRIRGLPAHKVQELSETLAEELATIVNTPAEHFTIEHIASQFFSKGAIDRGYPFIEVFWFARSPEVQKKTAEHLTAKVKLLDPEVDVTVIFQELNKTHYFENGHSF